MHQALAAAVCFHLADPMTFASFAVKIASFADLLIRRRDAAHTTCL